MYDDVLSENEMVALKLFNRTCSSVHGEFDKTANGLMGIWRVTLSIFSRSFGVSVLNCLLSAMLKRTPHWQEDIEKEPTTLGRLEKYFARCSQSLAPVSEGDYWKPGIFSYVGSGKSDIGYCLVHPDKKVAPRRTLCWQCVNKRRRLGLQAYPLDYGLLYVLASRLHFKTKGLPYCVNHPSKLAMANGLCEHCNERLGQLDEQLEEMKVSKLER